MSFLLAPPGDLEAGTGFHTTEDEQVATAIGNGRAVSKAGMDPAVANHAAQSQDYKLGFGQGQGDARSMGARNRITVADDLGHMKNAEFKRGYVDGWNSMSNKSFGGFLRAVRSGNPAEIEKQGGRYLAFEKANDELSGGAGGWLVPTEYTARFLKPLSERSFIYRRAHVIPMTTLTAKGPMLDATTAQAAGTPPWFGGVKGLWGSQAQTFTLSESNPQFRELTLTAWDFLLYSIASNQLLADMGPEADERLMENFGQAAAWGAEYAFLNGAGAGTSMPLGMLNAPCCINVARAGAGAISVADVAKMSGRLLPSGWMNAVWACNPSALEKVVQITSYQPNQHRSGSDLASEHVGYLEQRPLFVTDKLPKLGTRGDLMLFDPSLYVIGDRMQVVIDVSGETFAGAVNLFQANMSMFRVWLRLDGKPMLNDVVKLTGNPGDDTTTVSSVVALSDAA